VVVSNSLNSVTSSVAVLSVVKDIFPPKLLSAVVQDTGAQNIILVTFDERLLSSTAINTSNYMISRCDGSLVTVSNAMVIANTNVQLRVGGPNWVVGDDYLLTVNGVADTNSNVISVSNQVGVSFTEPLLTFSQSWTFYFDFLLSGTYPPPNWVTNNYDESTLSWGGPSPASFYYGDVPGACDRSTSLAQGPITYYFRTHFTAPS